MENKLKFLQSNISDLKTLQQKYKLADKCNVLDDLFTLMNIYSVYKETDKLHLLLVLLDNDMNLFINQFPLENMKEKMLDLHILDTLKDMNSQSSKVMT